jgi:hypothetical protein
LITTVTPQPPGVLGQPSIAEGQRTIVTQGVATDATGQVVIGTDGAQPWAMSDGQLTWITLGHDSRGTDGPPQLSCKTLGQLVRGTEMQAVTIEGQSTVVTLGQVRTTERSGPTKGEGTQLTAAFESSLPAPQAVFGTGPVKPSLRALLSRHCLICAWVRLGFFWNIRAMVPVMCGAAIEVPPIAW